MLEVECLLNVGSRAPVLFAASLEPWFTSVDLLTRAQLPIRPRCFRSSHDSGFIGLVASNGLPAHH